MALNREMPELKGNLEEIIGEVKVEASRINTIVVKEDCLLSANDLERLAQANDEAAGAHIVLNALEKFKNVPLARLIEQMEFNFHSHMNDGETPRHTLKVISNALVYLRGL